MSRVVGGFQQLGRALMLPIAVLPVAGLLLRLGQADLLGIPVLAAAGDAIFGNLGLVFAIGVAVGLARENHGAAGLASLVGFLVATKGAEVLLLVPSAATAGLTGAAADLAVSAYRSQQLAKLSMPVGILSGVIAGLAYNRFSDIELPSYLAFFGGRRFVPIVTGCMGLVVAIAFGLGWPMLARGMDALSHTVLGAGAWGQFAYGVLNRLLIVTGLHHILNNLAWFLIGDFQGATGDLRRFFAGDPTAGSFMSGFFPVMMFGLPGACLAMYRAAQPARRQAVAGLLLSIGLTSFLTGVTEPIEFTFMFLAPMLYAVHALLTGVAMVLMPALGTHLGFSFSAGFFDYVLNFPRATRPLLLLPIGALYFALYYALFRYGIARFNLATPGREAAESALAAPLRGVAGGNRAEGYIAALGGATNLTSVDACTTRLRLVLADGARVDEAALARLGARGVVRPGANVVQVVVGPIADQVAGEIRTSLRLPPFARDARGVAVPARSVPTAANDSRRAEALRDAVGGAGNVRGSAVAAGRLRFELRDATRVDRDALIRLGARGVVLLAGGVVQVLIDDPQSVVGQTSGPEAPSVPRRPS
jgi:N-acetylglucosamine PTS system EIICBA or EIICB component